MEGITVLALLVTVGFSSASLECIEGNCTEPVPVLTLNIGSIFPFFIPDSVDSDEESLEDSINPFASAVNGSKLQKQDAQDLISVNFMEVISFSDDDSEGPADFPSLQFMFQQGRTPDELGVLNLSGKNLTGEQLAGQITIREMLGGPVGTLILSNSRIHGLTASSFKPVESTLRELWMDNCSVSLDALSNLSNLRLLNLSNTNLSTFQWYPQLTDSLEVLDLSHNLLPEVRPELSILTNLRELYLSHNRITSVKEFPLVLLPNLEVVSFTRNSLNDGIFTSLDKLQLLELDQNYLRLFGDDFGPVLPPHRLSVRLASNPWRCDCGILEARDNYDVLDIDQLQCANNVAYYLCDDCNRPFLPNENGRSVAELTKDSIEHLGCTGISDQFYLLRRGLVQLRDHEPEKLVKLGILLVTCIFLIVAAIIMCRRSCSRKKFDRKSWLKIQQIPYLKIAKSEKPEEIPYIKIDTPDSKA